MTTSHSNDETELRLRIEERIQAVRARDVEALMSHYATDVATYDLITPLANLGSEAVRQRVVEWLASFQSPLEYDIQDLILAFGGEVAFDHHFTHVRGTTKDGAAVGYRKLQGHWKVVHQHSSVPIDMETQKGIFDLAP